MLLILFITLVCGGLAKDLPSTFQKCQRSSKEFNECLKSAIQAALPELSKGLPELNLPSLDPIHIPSMTIGEGKGPVQVVQKFQNVNIHGLGDARIQSVDARLTGANLELTVQAFVKEIRMEAEYDFNGRVLVLPIVGKGASEVVFNDLKVTFTLHGDEWIYKNKSYIQINQFLNSFQPAGITFNFKNLFNGDERLGSEMNRLLTENWEDVWNDIKEGYQKTFAVVFANFANLIFKKIPHEQVFLL